MAVSSLVFTATLHIYLRASWQSKHTTGISDLEPSQSLAGTGALTGFAAELSRIENGEGQKTPSKTNHREPWRNTVPLQSASACWHNGSRQIDFSDMQPVVKYTALN